jgi:ubiquinone/menaquinone biosynthesis C-methylase UbiE
LEKIVSWFSRANPKLREFFYTRWYQFLARSYPRQDWKFMNYGYSPEDGAGTAIPLEEADEYNRVYIQLYHHVASQVDLQGLSVLEVGCGRGGGSEYINRYMLPERMVGLDFSDNAVQFCNAAYELSGLSYQTGNAESLPFPDGSFDVVINVESSHCYGSIDAFLGQVKRVLRQGGFFLMADFRRKESLASLRDSLVRSGLTLINERDITSNIIQALEEDQDRKATFIDETVHKPLAGLFHQFAGGRGSKITERFVSGETVYLSYVLQNVPG